MFDKIKPIIHRVIAITAVALSCMFFASSLLAIMEDDYTLQTIFSVVLAGSAVLISFIWMWLSFQVRNVVYHYNDKIVSMYAGYLVHSLRVDGKLADKYTKWLWNVNTELSAKIDKDARIAVKVEPLNVISFKLYGSRYKKN